MTSSSLSDQYNSPPYLIPPPYLISPPYLIPHPPFTPVGPNPLLKTFCSKYTDFASTSRLFISQVSHPYSKTGLITVVYSLILHSSSVSHEIPLYGTRMLTTMFTTAHHWSLSQARWIQTACDTLLKHAIILARLLHLGLPRHFLRSSFPTEVLTTFVTYPTSPLTSHWQRPVKTANYKSHYDVPSLRPNILLGTLFSRSPVGCAILFSYFRNCLHEHAHTVVSVKPNTEVRWFRYTDSTTPSSITSKQTKTVFHKPLINYALTAVHRSSLNSPLLMRPQTGPFNQ